MNSQEFYIVQMTVGYCVSNVANIVMLVLK